MKKIAILLLAILIFSCSDDDEKGTVENKGQWATNQFHSLTI